MLPEQMLDALPRFGGKLGPGHQVVVIDLSREVGERSAQEGDLARVPPAGQAGDQVDSERPALGTCQRAVERLG